jgi:anthranilate/para-aminobenzoate synthase component I
MKIIEELESCRRGFCRGAIGGIGLDGDMDTGIAIRALVEKGGQGVVSGRRRRCRLGGHGGIPGVPRQGGNLP